MQYVVSNARQFINAKRKTGVSRQRGATLVEIILYLAVAAIVIFAVFSLFSNAFGGGKSQSEITSIQGIASGVNSIYGTQRTYPSGSLVPALIQTKAAPSATIDPSSTTSLRNSFGGAITVIGYDTQYQISTGGLPQRACAELAQINIGAIGMNINGTETPSPATAGNAVANCNGNPNTITWAIR